MDQAFKDIMLEKDKKGLLHFLKPSLDYKKVSDWLITVDDLSGNKYKPLILDEDFWRNTYQKNTALTGCGGNFVIKNFQNGDHSYSEVLELLYQSNPHTLLPVLKWDESVRHQLL